MSILVECFNEKKAKEEIKKCPKIVRDYVKLLQYSLSSQQLLTAKAIGKLQCIAKEFQKYKEGETK